MKKEYYLEMGFRVLTLLFWPIIIYKWIFISNVYIERNAFFIFGIFSILYMIIIGILQIKNKIFHKIVIYYRFTTLISFILTLATFLLYPTNITLMLLKIFSIFVYFYISFKGVYKYKNEEYVVGMISSILLLAISICY